MLIQGSYTEQGLRGLLKEGGSSRREAVEQLISGLGGKVQAFYFAYGSDDFVIIADAVDPVSAIAGSLIVNVSGAARVRTTVLITPEEMDRAAKMTVSYRPPGQ